MTHEVGTRVHLYLASVPLGPVGSATILEHLPHTCDGTDCPCTHPGHYRVQQRDGNVVLWPAEQTRLPERFPL